MGSIVRASNDASCDDTCDSMDDEHAALRTILSARRKAGLTQTEVAKRMGTTAPAVSRLEAALSRRGHSPTFAILRKYAAACGKKLVISLA
jgi:transcriptional regulator with XRE-family HTH domain